MLFAKQVNILLYHFDNFLEIIYWKAIKIYNILILVGRKPSLHGDQIAHQEGKGSISQIFLQ